MVGLPATGKTTMARQIAADHRAIRLTPDEWMIPLLGEPEGDGVRDVLEGRFIWLAIEALRHGSNVVLDFGVWSKPERSALRYLAAKCGADFQLLLSTAEHDEQLRRIAGRQESDPGLTFEITSDELVEFRSRFQEPDVKELETDEIEPPPQGYSTWERWAAERWPTSMDSDSTLAARKATSGASEPRLGRYKTRIGLVGDDGT
jgi:predicted kinase